MRNRRAGFVASCVAAALINSAWASDPPASPASDTKTESKGEVQRLKDQLAKQQAQIEALRNALEDQKKLLESIASKEATAATPSGGKSPDQLMASSVPMITPASAEPAPRRAETPLPAPAQNATAANAAGPLQIKLGETTIIPIGFMDATGVWRDKNAGSGIGSNFGNIPFNNVPAGKLTEFRFSPQNSRLGFRVDGKWKDWRFIAYNEFDFLGTSGSNAIGVTNGAFVPRLRLFWVDVRKGKFEMLAGQSWSLLTPNRKGLSALPGDLFYSQVIDVNYMAGLTWTRQPGYRFIYHPSDTVAMGLSLENPNQYMGGSAGAPQVVLPAALTTLAGTQLDNTSTSPLSTPNLVPDVIGKIAFDPNDRAHIEIAGLLRTFKIWNFNSLEHFTKVGGGGSINANFGLTKSLRLVTNNYWSDGGGRYLFGQGPDLVVRADGSLSPIHAGGTVQGFEYTRGKWLLYAYYGAIYLGRNVVVDANGTTLVGYGFRGSPNSQNRAIQEISGGFNQTLFKDPRYGAINFMGQYEYLTRAPWYVAVNSPKATHDNTVYFNLRYTLPGAPPAIK
jgi:hypothetical protein